MAALALAGDRPIRGAGHQPKKTNGNYTVTIGGYYTGTGTLSVKANHVQIKGTVTLTGGSGGKLNFNAANLKLDGDHFEGKANVQGAKFTVIGRLDGYDGDPDFRGARALAGYSDNAGKGGRIAGILPQ